MDPARKPDQTPSGARARNTIRDWLPHVLLLGMIAAGLWLVALVLAPLLEPLLLAAATAALTHPVLFDPLSRLVDRVVPSWSQAFRRQVASLMATVSLLIIVLSPLALVLLTVVQSFDEGMQLLLGVALQDETRLHPFFLGLLDNLQRLADLYPGLQLDADLIVASIKDLLASSNQLGPTMLNFLFRGSGHIAEIVFAIISLTFFYAHGPLLVQHILDVTPMTNVQQERMVHRHGQISEFILVTGLGTAVVKGMFFGVISWAAGIPVPPLLIVVVATVLSLLPMIGLTMVWLPLAAMAWSKGQQGTAIAIALISLIANYGFDHLRHRYQHRKGLINESWLNFALFLGLVGGVLAFGPMGLIIGPAAVSIATLLGRHGLPVYHVRGSANDEVE
ncbi:MAG: AI-2E family transporter [Planctomycetota bacterium]